LPEIFAVKHALAARLRELRKAKGWSQEKLAEEARMHRTYLAGIERSLRNPSLANIVKLANALETSLPELFTGEAKVPAPAKSSKRALKPKRAAAE
jgi:transcriptional regulator with XRE-family HTH domain